MMGQKQHRSVVAAAAALLALALSASLVLAQEKPDLSSPKAAAKTFADAVTAGDVARAKAVSTGNEKQTTILEAMVNLLGGMKKLEDAMIAKYGAEAVRAGKSPVSSAELQESIQRLTEGDVKVTGDTAVITPKKKEGATPGQSEPWTLRKSGSDWKVDLGSLTKEIEKSEDAPAQVDGMKAFAVMIQGMTAEVAAGKYRSVGEANQAISQSFMKMGAELAAKQQKATPQPNPPAKKEQGKQERK
jgi:hypothetical protein